MNASSIGCLLKIEHNVTIGATDKGVPTIGNNVQIGCSACVLGNIHIGNNVIIGANTVVVKDVPSDVTIAGNPAHIIKKYGKKINIKL